MSSIAPDTAPPASDEDLIHRAAEGRPEALAALYERYAPLVFGMARQAVDRATAEEIVQDVFFAVWKNAATFRPDRGRLRPWLLQIAHHRISNELRRRSRRPRTDSGPEDETLAAVPDAGLAPDESAWLAYRRDVLQSALEKLPPRERQAVGLAFFQDLSHEQVAAALRVPLGTAKSRIRAGLQRLRTGLAPLVAALAAVAVLAGVLARLAAERRERGRDDRALALLTSSDAESRRATAAPGAPAAAHAVYRFRRGSPIAVITFSFFPPAPAGAVYRAWVRHGAAWTLVGGARPDAAGHVRLVAEGAALAASPDAVEVTLETGSPGSAPSGTVVVAWPAPVDR